MVEGEKKKKKKSLDTKFISFEASGNPKLAAVNSFHFFSACLHIKADVPVVDEGAIVVVVRGMFSTVIQKYHTYFFLLFMTTRPNNRQT